MQIIIYIVFILLFLILLNLIISHLFKKIIRRRSLKAFRNSKNIFLTFDDGPSPESTPKIIELLKKYNFAATFFITGENGERYPGIVNALIENGNLIGSHGYSHIHPWKSGIIKTVIDLIRMERYFKSMNRGTNLYRPPYGKFNILSLIYFAVKKNKIIFWDIDPEDYNSVDPDKTADQIIGQMKPGSIVLLHDGRDNPDRRSSVETTIRIVELVAEYADRNNLKISPIDSAY